MPSVLIDATHVGAHQATGVENYTSELLPRLSLLLLEQGVEVAWVGHQATAPTTLPSGVTWLVSPHRPLWSQRALLGLLQEKRPDLFFTPSGLSPVLYRGKVALTVHDMAAYLFPPAFTVSQQVRLRGLLQRCARQASLIFTPSQYSQGQIARLWKIPPERIRVTPLGFSSSSAEPVPLPEVDPSQPLLLFVGRLEAKKNVGRLVSAFAALNHPQAQLVLAGKDGYGAEAIHSQIASLPEQLRRRVVTPGYVSDGSREWLLHQATVALVPGSVEGASLPLLEALAHGLPTVCAEAGPLPEIGGEAALYAHPEQTEAWVACLSQLLDDPQVRRRLADQGPKRVATFTWERTAQLTAEGIHAALAA